MRGFFIFMVVVVAGQAVAQAQSAVDPKARQKIVDKAAAYLKSRQADDGTWSKASSPGITATVVRALVRSGALPAKDPTIEKGLKFIEGMANAEAGHLAGAGKMGRQVNYLTSVNLLALLEADPKRYASLGERAATFLKGQVYDESHGKSPTDVYYGGFGYDATTRPDVSNTIFGLEALRAAKTPANDPVFRKILVFVSRSQNLKGEHNDQPWAGKINDGSFIYGAGPAGAPRDKTAASDAPRPGYGSITCSGTLSLLDCGVSKDDPRFRKAFEWITKDFTVEHNPGVEGGERGYYLYLHVLAAVLDRAAVDVVTDSKKQTHDWRAEITSVLRARQRADGSWSNKSPAWLESNADLATSWALMALSYTRPK